MTTRQTTIVPDRARGVVMRDFQLSPEMLELTQQQLQHMALTFAIVFSLALIPSTVQSIAQGLPWSHMRNQVVAWVVFAGVAIVSLSVYFGLKRGWWHSEQISGVGLNFDTTWKSWCSASAPSRSTA